jgi:predicted transglutaminase-like protease
LRHIDARNELEKDKLAEYLDRESSAANIRLHQEDIKAELMNEDILKNSELPNTQNYQTPFQVANRYRDLPTLDEIAGTAGQMKTPVS